MVVAILLAPRIGFAAETPLPDAPETPPSNALPAIYLDVSATLSRSPGNSFVIGRRGFFSLTDSASKSLSLDVPLTIDVTDALTIYAGSNFSSTATASSPWSQLAAGSFTTGFDYTFAEQTRLLPELSVSGSVSRPVHIPVGTAMTTTWSGGIDADYAFDEDGTRGLIGGVALTYVAVNSGPGRVEPVYGGYLGAYRQWEGGWKLTGKSGYAIFGGGSLGTIIRARPVRQIFATLEVEKYDAADNKIFGLGLAGALSRSVNEKTNVSVQLMLSVPIYMLSRR
ncbi:hypothetical protein [Bosea sp. PAMC 26642]|uniref:hypothetical protein n=1 Tax=Bosea sp. (strain PAMC 26642) TaxID=1792307 RepID=UPI0007701C8E|nr:hypothetical protein [Bosea sp. PAMC 26642]AMJ62015.1 hypothetical protein AXW83_18430 [Bosea sp. PAMC 26642]